MKRRSLTIVILFATILNSFSQEYPDAIPFNEVYPNSLNKFITKLNLQKDALELDGNKKDFRLSAQIEKMLKRTKYVLNQGEFDHSVIDQIPFGLKLIDKFELSKKLRSNDDNSIMVYRIGTIKLTNGHILVPISIVNPSLDSNTGLLMFESNGNIIINYKYDCTKDVFYFNKFGD
ncbi:hypothetical protein ABV409_15150 [Flagellimonas sp. DF-77]|uniref:hypothetical protein n=1 Tax=Flagellimonas algarum TaxID=3230298 RepID=UPI0033990F20